jgi:hypothetical protein
VTVTAAVLAYAARHRLHVLHHTCRWHAGRVLRTGSGAALTSCLLVREGWWTSSVVRWTPATDRHETLTSGRPAAVIAWLAAR